MEHMPEPTNPDTAADSKQEKSPLELIKEHPNYADFEKAVNDYGDFMQSSIISPEFILKQMETTPEKYREVQMVLDGYARKELDQARHVRTIIESVLNPDPGSARIVRQD